MSNAAPTMASVFTDRPRLEEVAPRVYRIDLCVPKALGPTNSYLFHADGVHDNGRSLIIDVGCSQPQTRALYAEALAQLGIPWDKVDVFITHFHWDHCAGLAQVWQRGMTVYGGEADFADRGLPIMAGERIGEIERETSERHNFFEDYDHSFWEPMRDLSWGNYPITQLYDGDELSVAGYTLRVLETPGHDMHHLCLYDEKARLFVGGDQVIESMYPPVILESESDQMAAAQATLRRLETLDANIVLCGHGGEGTNLSERCRQIREHYDRQLVDFLEVCASGETDPGELSYLSTHRPRRRTWEERGIFARRALICQNMAYLKHLVAAGKLPDQYEIIALS